MLFQIEGIRQLLISGSIISCEVARLVTLTGEFAKGLSTSGGRTSFEPWSPSAPPDAGKPVNVPYQRFQMKENTLKKLELLLLNRRREIFKQVAHLEAEREELEQRFIEPIDAAQKEDLVRLVHKFNERGKEEIEEIELAIDKIESGSYGNCELCGKSIPIKRLKVLPATRLCRNCAQKYEENQKLRKHHRDEIIDDVVLDEYRSLNDENSSIGHLKLPDDENLLSMEEV
jgi:DnaK suppressor protein